MVVGLGVALPIAGEIHGLAALECQPRKPMHLRAVVHASVKAKLKRGNVRGNVSTRLTRGTRIGRTQTRGPIRSSTRGEKNRSHTLPKATRPTRSALINYASFGVFAPT